MSRKLEDPPHGFLPVSVILPARDEAPAMLAQAVGSALCQDYGAGLEVIIADGSDTPAMADAIRRWYPQVRVIPNPERTISHGLNRALRTAAHPIIVRCDARSVLPPGYVARAVQTLTATGAVNVGGRQNPVGTTAFERAVALAMTSALGAGDARYRLGGPEGAADTVYLGVFRRDAVEAVGGFDPSLLCNEDYELNWRLRERGETIWFDPALAVDYRPRGDLRALARQYFRYGFWKRVMLERHPASLRYRQLAAPLLVAGLGVSTLLAAAGGSLVGLAAAPALGPVLLGAAALMPGAYLLLVAGGAAALGVKRRDPHARLLPLVLAAIHLSWGAGFFVSWLTGRRTPARTAANR